MTTTTTPWPGVPLPGNRWDLLAAREPGTWPDVGVVVAHYRQPEQLALTLAALDAQRYPGRVHVVVADDGSPEPPRVPAHVGLVRQDDQGFRAAAARNLGARHVAGEVLAFLDADTVPEPDYLVRAVRLPALSPEAVVVGRRRHARLTGPDDDPSWPPAHPLDEPAWLADGYRRSGNLLDADDRSYRYVLSSVLTLHRRLFDEIGGFDESMIGYGGEDWELAHRAWRAGALLAHEPRAVAWHDGPDFAGRDEPARRATKATETLALATRVPIPGSRPPGVVGAVPDVLVRIGSADGGAGGTRPDVAGGSEPDVAAVVATAVAVLACDGAHVRLPVVVPAALRADPRVTGTGDALPAEAVRGTVDLAQGVRPAPGTFDSAVAAAHRQGWHTVHLTIDGAEVGSLVTARGRARLDRWGALCADGEGTVEIDAVVSPRPDLEAVFGGWG